MTRYRIYISSKFRFLLLDVKEKDMTRIKEQRSEKEERMFLLNSINLWMNNFISFRRNHVLLLASYTHVHLYRCISTPPYILAHLRHERRAKVTCAGSVNLSTHHRYHAGRGLGVVRTLSFRSISSSIHSIPNRYSVKISIGLVKDLMNIDTNEYW